MPVPAAPFLDTFDGSTLTLSGTAEPGATIVIINNGTTQVGSAVTAGQDGRFAIVIDLPVESVNYSFVAVASNLDGDSDPSGAITVLNGNVSTFTGFRVSGAADLDYTFVGGSDNDQLGFNTTGDLTLIGGLGDEQYYIDSLDDLIVELPGEGIDRVNLQASGFDYTLPANLEQIFDSSFSPRTLTGNSLDNQISGSGEVYGLAGNDRLLATSAALLEGGEGNDTVDGSDLSDTLNGGNGDDTLIGDDGEDFLDGGAGTDVAEYKGLFADFYITQEGDGFRIMDPRERNLFEFSATDHVVNVETFRFWDKDVAAADLLDRSGERPAAPLLNLLDVELGRIGGTAEPGSTVSVRRTFNFGSSNITVGNDVADAEGNWQIDLDAEHLVSGAFSATAQNPNGISSRSEYAILGSFEPRTVSNGSGFIPDTIIGAETNDLLLGGYQTSTLIGNGGNDTYILRSEDSTVIEDPDEGIDTIEASFESYTLPDNFENLTGRGTAQTLTGNSLDNVIVDNLGLGDGAVSFGDDLIDGLGGNDTLTAQYGNDTLRGGDGSDLLEGGFDDDSLDGGAGIDVAVYSGARADYLITVIPGGFRIADLRQNGDGTDEVYNVENFQFADGMRDENGLDPSLPPDAIDDLAVTDEDESVVIDVLSNDTDANGDALTVTAASDPASGSALITGDGTVTYTPDSGFAGTDSFTYTISDGNGGTDTATVTITINPVNDAPLAGDDTISAASDTIRTIDAATLLANDSDIDGDALTITSVQGALNGTVALAGTTVTFTPEAGFTGAASFTYTVSDGNGGSDTASVAVTVTEGNQPPVAPATQAATTLRGAAILVEVGASDPDGDVLTYGVSGAVNGTASIDEDGLVTYTPDAGFTGSETLVVTIDDGNGGSASQEIALTVSALPAANQFRLFASDGFAGSIGGSGAVIGTGGFQDIAVLDVAGTVSFDPSFNQGDDIVRLSGDADDWYVSKSGSSAIFTDGDTFVQLAVGPAGMAVVFDDGARTLRLDVGGGGAFLIGDQVFTATLARVDAAPDGTTLPGGADAQASARLFLAEDGGASAAGKVNVIGTGGAEIATLLSGTITLDPSFNKGGDVIRVDEAAEDFLASKSGSSALLVGSDTTLLVPVGLAGATLAFGDGSDTRELFLSIEPNGITIDEQFFGVDPVRLMAAV